MEAILELKGIPIPKEIDLNRSAAAVENLETRPPGPSISAPLLSAPVPDPQSPTRPASAPAPGNSPGNVDKEAAGWSCAGVNYELQCQV